MNTNKIKNLLLVLSLILSPALYAVKNSDSPGTIERKERTNQIITVFDFRNNTNVPELGRQIAEIARVLIPDFRKFLVIDRGILKKALQKLKLDIKTTMDSGNGIIAAKILKSDYFIVGSIGRLANTYSINIKLIDTKTGQVVKASGLEFSDMMEIRNLTLSLLDKILSHGRVSGKPVITEYEFRKRKKKRGIALSYTIGSTIIQAAALGGAILMPLEYNPAHIWTSLALAIPSYAPIYTEDWDYAPFIVGSSIGSGVFNFVGYALVESVPESSKNYKDGDAFKKDFGEALFTVAAILKITAVLLDMVRATQSVKEYNENLRKDFFITLDMKYKNNFYNGSKTASVYQNETNNNGENIILLSMNYKW